MAGFLTFLTGGRQPRGRGALRPTWGQVVPLAIVFAVAVESAAAPERLVDTARSMVTVRVAGEGWLRAFATPIVVQAVFDEGSVDESIPHMQVVIDARRLRVEPTGLSQAERNAVQLRMLGPDVLDVSRFPRITYHSITIDRQPQDAARSAGSTGRWLIRGELELHGHILPVTATARREGDRYVGSATVRQSDFGIAPVSRWGGLVRVKDDIAIEFDVALKPSRSSRTGLGYTGVRYRGGFR
jgi:polyisoprenoid-binding protein YceI